MSHHLLKHFSTSLPFEIIDGSLPVIQYLSDKNIKLGVISNYDKRLETILVQLGLRHYFSFVLDSYSVGVAKPDPLIFSSALKKSGIDINPENALHIGDNIDFDYLGAREAGWQSLLVTPDIDSQCQKHSIQKCSNSMFTSIIDSLDYIKSNLD